jgi:hypothetical protein
LFCSGLLAGFYFGVDIERFFNKTQALSRDRHAL